MILVTGADGLVGRALCAHLMEVGVSVLPVVRERAAWTLPDALVIDLSREVSLDGCIPQAIRAVVHLAAAVPHSARYPDSDASADLTRTMDAVVLRFVISRRCPVVYASSCGLYDPHSSAPKDEDDPTALTIRGPYFRAKFDGERLFAGKAGAVIARLSAPVGPGMQAGLVLRRFVDLALAGAAIEIWGSGTREQDFVDVRDISRILASAAFNPQATTINVAAGQPTTMRTLANTVVSTLGCGRVRFSDLSDPQEGQTARYVTTRVRDIYGWRPHFALADSIRTVASDVVERRCRTTLMERP